MSEPTEPTEPADLAATVDPLDPIDPVDVNCAAFVTMVTDYVEGVIAADAVARIDAHLAVCPGCVVVLDQFREVIRVSGSLRDEHVEGLQPDVRASLLRAFHDARHPDP